VDGTDDDDSEDHEDDEYEDPPFYYHGKPIVSAIIKQYDFTGAWYREEWADEHGGSGQQEC